MFAVLFVVAFGFLGCTAVLLTLSDKVPFVWA